MMENPASWGHAEHIVSRVLDEHERQSRMAERGQMEPLAGLSLVRKITDALREAGLLHGAVPHARSGGGS